jgi:hypothetical protein
MVFVNCPFDKAYTPIFRAIIFTIFDCGYYPRCALEGEDSGQVRIDKIYKLIKECKYGIHDISRTKLDRATKLPRFNMPLELGIFLGAKRFGDSNDKKKNCLILDSEKYRFQAFISDISGQDIRSHGDDVTKTVESVRNWLSNVSKRSTIPGGGEIKRRYSKFQKDLPNMCKVLKLNVSKLTYKDYATIASEWLSLN